MIEFELQGTRLYQQRLFPNPAPLDAFTKTDLQALHKRVDALAKGLT